MLPPIDIKKLKRKRRTDPLEKDIEREVCLYAKSLGIESRKFTSPQRRSVPDRIFFLGDGRCAFIEFKRLGEKPTEGQLREHEWLRDRGQDVWVVDDVEIGKQVADTWKMYYGRSTHG